VSQYRPPFPAAGVPRRVLSVPVWAIATKEQLEAALATDVLASLLQLSEQQQLLPILSCMVDAVSEPDYALLDDLERLIREKRLTGS
jgi:hypothetical protein